MAELGLAEAIRHLRREITAAAQAGVGEDLQFTLGEIELELEVELVASASATAELKWVVVSLGGEGKGERSQRHRVKLTLTPSLDNAPVKVQRDGRPG